MKRANYVSLFLFYLILCVASISCAYSATNVDNNQTFQLIEIRHLGYRGMGYTDSLGVEYNLRHNPVFLTNHSNVPITVNLTFEHVYAYPNSNEDVRFYVFPLPEVWAESETDDDGYNHMLEDLPNYIDEPTKKLNVMAGEQVRFAIGTAHLNPKERWTAAPNGLFIADTLSIDHDCQGQTMNVNNSGRLTLGTKIMLGDGCLVIPCGEVIFHARPE